MTVPKIKICGMKYPKNMMKTAALSPDYLGFIFHEKSPRYMRNTLKPKHLCLLPDSIKKIGVFVNENIDKIKQTAQDYPLDMLQLHGEESVDYCYRLHREGFKIIKAFRLEKPEEVDALKNYAEVVDFFLFDTAGENYGGNGITFDWKLLQRYHLKIPYFLSGGLNPTNIRRALDLKLNHLQGFDANSGLESSPGLKDIHKVDQFIKTQNKNEDLYSR